MGGLPKMLKQDFHIVLDVKSNCYVELKLFALWKKNGTLKKSKPLVIISGTGSIKPIPLLNGHGRIMSTGTWTTRT